MKGMVLASKINLELTTNRKGLRIYPINLHSICYNMAGPEYPHPMNIPPVFQPVVTRFEETNNCTNVKLEISSIDEKFSALFMNNVKNKRVVYCGHIPLSVKKIWLDRHELLPTSPEAIREILPNVFEIHFITPTVFQKEGRIFYVMPSLLSMMMSVGRNLGILFGIKLPRDIIRSINKKIGITSANIRTETVLTGIADDQEIPAFTGNIELSLHHLNDEEKRTLTFLLKWAEWMGVGKRRGYGLGAIRVKSKNESVKRQAM